MFETVRQARRGSAGFPLCAIVHDETFLLPAFLAHYRALGVEHFVLLDDASTDGTRALLAEQPDCTVLRSDVRYFEMVEGRRAVYAWRTELMQRYGMGRWALLVDADEFLVPPPGLTLPDLAASLERRGSASAWAVMLECYPRDLAALAQMAERPFSLDDEWYLDARPHLRVTPGAKRPRRLHGGAISRWVGTHRVVGPAHKWHKALAIKLGLGALVTRSAFTKVPLMRWSPAHRHKGAHGVVPPPAVDDVLPMLHFKFTADLPRKIAYALESRGYHADSRYYVMLQRMLERMEGSPRPFLGPHSRRYTGAAMLYACGAGRWEVRGER